SQQNPALLFTQSDTAVQATLVIQFETGCSLTVTDEFDVYVFNPDFLPDTLHACPTQTTVELNPGGDSTYQYQWSPAANLSDPNYWNPTATVTGTTTYVVTITDLNQTDFCQADKTVTVTVTNAIGLQVPEEAEACRAILDTLTASATLSPVNFLWSSQADFSDTMSLIASMEVMLEMPTTYFVQATDEFGCKEIGEVQVGAYPVLAQLLDSEKICKGNVPDVTISSLQPDEVVTWQPYDPSTQPLNENTTFIATFVNSHGCTVTDTIKLIAVDQNKEFTVVPALDTIIAGESTMLRVLSENSNIVCFWSPDQSLDDAGNCQVLATPAESTVYTVLVEDVETGCRGTAEATVCVVSNLCDEPMIFVPNAFSPNGDGRNDVLFVRGFNVERVLVFAIYNRWGEKVFETTDQTQGWDGMYNGKTVTGDVFVYYLKVECKSGEEYFTKGNVTLLK
ncbi:MAG: gliding motility-associated C-terminal domain-containing protein, partial [Bacteroidota bacterium]